MKLIKKALFTFMLLVLSLPNLCIFNVTLAQGSPYDAVIRTTIHNPKWPWWSLESVASKDVIQDGSLKWWGLFTEQVKQLIWYAIDVFIIIGISIAFLGGYKIITSNSEDKMKEWIRLVIFGVLWIIIMMSARFLAEWLVWNGGIIDKQFPTGESSPKWITLAKDLYENLMFPFIKVALYLVVWALFFIMAAKVITFVISTDEAAKKKAGGIILWCVIWIFIVMWSKQIVEAVMWDQEDVLNDAATWIDQQWNHLEEFNSIQLISQIINWVMWLTMFVMVVLIIIQGYRMFTKPDDPKNRERLKKTLLYVIIWVLVIWASYVISNVLVLNGFNSIQW